MRELTAAEIERFDFSGEIPELGPTSAPMQKTAVAKKSQNRPNINIRSAKKPRLRFA
jgi:hypothetical protein